MTPSSSHERRTTAANTDPRRTHATRITAGGELVAAHWSPSSPEAALRPPRPSRSTPARAATAAAGRRGGDVRRRASSSSSILLPKFTGIAVFDQANEGAQEAAAELGTTPAEFLGPTADNSIDGQIEIMTNAATQGVDAVMISNNAGDQIVPGRAGRGRGRRPRRDVGLADPVGRGREPVRRPGRLRRDRPGDGRHGARHPRRRRRPVGDPVGVARRRQPERLDRGVQGGRSAGDDYANIELVDTVYGNDESEESYNQALALVDQYPDLELIMAPTTVGIAAAAKAMQDEGLCEQVQVSGLGLPDEMRSTPRAAAPRSSRCGASSTSATSRTTSRTASRPGRSRPRRARRSTPAGWARTRSRPTRPATTACGW